MRRALVKVLPALSYHFGLRWDHIEGMPASELQSYLASLKQIQDDLKG